MIDPFWVMCTLKIKSFPFFSYFDFAKKTYHYKKEHFSHFDFAKKTYHYKKEQWGNLSLHWLDFLQLFLLGRNLSDVVLNKDIFRNGLNTQFVRILMGWTEKTLYLPNNQI